MVEPERGTIVGTQCEKYYMSRQHKKSTSAPLSHDLQGQEGLCLISSRAPASLTAMILYWISLYKPFKAGQLRHF